MVEDPLEFFGAASGSRFPCMVQPLQPINTRISRTDRRDNQRDFFIRSPEVAPQTSDLNPVPNPEFLPRKDNVAKTSQEEFAASARGQGLENTLWCTKKARLSAPAE
jgi:hypothetical protein